MIWVIEIPSSGGTQADMRSGRRRAALVLFREGGDDTKAVALDSVVSDTGHVAEVDDLAPEGLQPLRVCRADGRQRERQLGETEQALELNVSVVELQRGVRLRQPPVASSTPCSYV
jgi:hypothetical protein